MILLIALATVLSILRLTVYLLYAILRTLYNLTLYLLLPLIILMGTAWSCGLAATVYSTTRQHIIPYISSFLGAMLHLPDMALDTMMTTIYGSLSDLILESLRYAEHLIIGQWTCPPPLRYMYIYTYEQSDYCKWYNRETAPVEDHHANIVTVALLMLTTAFVSTTMFIWIWTRQTGLTPGMWMREKLDAKLRPQHLFNASALRARFSEVSMVLHTPIKSHSHGTSAANRSTGNLFIDQLSRLTGLNPYYYQCSKTDQRRGRDGSRSYFWPKDLLVEPQAFCPADKDFIAMVDVDQYVNIPSFSSCK